MIQTSLLKQYFSQGGGYINFEERSSTCLKNNLQVQIFNNQDLKSSQEKMPAQTQNTCYFNQTDSKKKQRKPLVYKSNNFFQEQSESNVSSTCQQIDIKKADINEQIINSNKNLSEANQKQGERQTTSLQTQECNSFDNSNQNISLLQKIKNQIQQELNVILQFQCIQQLQNFTNSLGMKLNFQQKHINMCCLNFLSLCVSQKIFQDILNNNKNIHQKKCQMRYRKYKYQKKQDQEYEIKEVQEAPYTVHLNDIPQDLGDWNSFEIKKLDETDSFNEEDSSRDENDSQYIEQNFPLLQVEQNLKTKDEQIQTCSDQINTKSEDTIENHSQKEGRVNSQQQQKCSSSSFSSIEIAKIDENSRQSEFHSLSGEKEKLCFDKQMSNNFQLKNEQTNIQIKQFKLDEVNDQKPISISDLCLNNVQPLNILYKKNALLEKIQKIQKEQKLRQNLNKQIDILNYQETNEESDKICDITISKGDDKKLFQNQWEEDDLSLQEINSNQIQNQQTNNKEESKLPSKSEFGSFQFQNSQSMVQEKLSNIENNKKLTFQKFQQQRQYLKMQLRAIEGIKDLKLGCKVYNDNIYIYEKEEPPFLRGFNIFQCCNINKIVDWCQNESEFQDKFQSKIIVDVQIQDQFKGFFNQILLRPDGYFKQGNLQLISKFTRRPSFISNDPQNSTLISQKETCKAMEFTLINLKLVNPREFYEEINQCNKYLQDKTFDFEFIEIEYLQRKCQESLNYEFKLIFEKQKMVKQLIGALNSLAQKTNFIFGISDIDKQRNQEIYYEHLLNSQFNKKNICNTLDKFINQTLEIINQNLSVPGDDAQIKAWKKQNEIRIEINEEVLVIEFQILKISDKLYPIKMIVPSSSNLFMVKNEKCKLPNHQGNYTYVRQNASVNILLENQKPNLQIKLQEEDLQEISQFYEFKKEFLSKIKK
ncbi:hypothetical protein TTHERM_00529690 (macronuclear) [Tetrahymena thermophila SB210]|uniref:Uncharacterized protein n=1 Tax=Tetrahymena thermophila (strain SB210) TaxID=312017 RepID=I7MGC1_TETTS|nr:hypothetical protein TTHERM_00529690 [Tetrahymena thermophila SB210]EAR85017.1 hypothetical protein TTHERM_00529690 [Tetrahymena thermophila SB210]|eukprot:XP_001032680.1 hypothetical protein TTHERM_00529690 [Tetrahymena thermophila SB210]